MKRVILSIAGASLLFLSPAVLADHLRDKVANQLQREGIQVEDLATLSDAQVGQIEMVLAAQGGKETKQAEIRRLASAPVPCAANDQLRSSAQEGLTRLGFADVNAADLSGQEVVEIGLVLSGTGGASEKRTRIAHLLGRDAGEMMHSDQLHTEVANCLRRLNIDIAELDALTPQQVAEIGLVVQGNQSESSQRQQINSIVGQ